MTTVGNRYAPDNNFTGYPVTLDIQPVIWLKKKIPSSLWYVFFHNGIGQHWYLCSRRRRQPKQSPSGSATRLESSDADPDPHGQMRIRTILEGLKSGLPEPVPPRAGVFGWSRSRFFGPAPTPASSPTPTPYLL